MRFTLTRDLLEEFLNKHDNEDIANIGDAELKEIIDGALRWECEVSLLSYFFAKRVQRKQNFKSLNLDEIDRFYCLDGEGFFNFQNFDRDFISYIFDYSRSRMTLSLEELVVEVQQDFTENKYDSDFRY